MKLINLISFYFKEDFLYPYKDKLSSIEKNLYLHIDNAKIGGWTKDNLIIKTNFDFEYKDIKNISFQYNQCINLFLTKIVAAYEVLSIYPDSILWQHDHDTYQIREFDYNILSTELISDINMCKYWTNNIQPQSASIFYKGMSKTLEDMYEYIKLPNEDFLSPKYGDEETFLHFQNLGYSINTNLSFAYNTSLTKYSCNKRKHSNPYCLHGDLINNRFHQKQYMKYAENSLLQFEQNKQE